MSALRKYYPDEPINDYYPDEPVTGYAPDYCSQQSVGNERLQTDRATFTIPFPSSHRVTARLQLVPRSNLFHSQKGLKSMHFPLAEARLKTDIPLPFVPMLVPTVSQIEEAKKHEAKQVEILKEYLSTFVLEACSEDIEPIQNWRRCADVFSNACLILRYECSDEELRGMRREFLRVACCVRDLVEMTKEPRANNHPTLFAYESANNP